MNDIEQMKKALQELRSKIIEARIVSWLGFITMDQIKMLPEIDRVLRVLQDAECSDLEKLEAAQEAKRLIRMAGARQGS